MAFALAVSRAALGLALGALLFIRVAPRWARPPSLRRRKLAMAIGTLALGLAIFALFFGLVAACDRL